MSHFIGIDVHKKTSHIVVLEGTTGLPVLDKNIQTTRPRFEAVLGPLAPAKVLLEASTQSRWIADHLRELGHEVVVCDPNYAMTYASRPANRKNDREDARALATACRAGHFRAVHRVTDEHRMLQELLGSRAAIIETRTAHINRIRALFGGSGLPLPRGQAESFRANLVRAGIPSRLEGAVRPLLEMLAMVEDQLEACDKRLTALAEAMPVARILMTVPGVGPIVALAFIAWVDDPSRFASAHQVESYFGLVPKLHTSAGPGRGGRVSKMGPTYVRALLVQSSWALLRSNDAKALSLQEWAQSVANRRNAGIAVTALARRLVGVLWAMWRDMTPFEARESRTSATGDRRRYLLRRQR